VVRRAKRRKPPSTWWRLGHTKAAEAVLLTVERAASEWTAHQQLPRVLIGELITRGRPSAWLRDLAHRLSAR
jgi:hypothetical protein